METAEALVKHVDGGKLTQEVSHVPAMLSFKEDEWTIPAGDDSLCDTRALQQ